MQLLAHNKDMVAREGLETPPPAFSGLRESIIATFVARVALEVVDSSWWKQQLRVKSAGSRKLPSHRMGGIAAATALKGPRLAVSY
jgi:hypothetical protein